MATEIYTPPQLLDGTKIYTPLDDQTGTTTYEDPNKVLFVGDVHLAGTNPTAVVA